MNEYIHRDASEESLSIDLSILTFLREEILLGNLDYVSLAEPYKRGLFSSDIDCSWEYFRRRALYQIWLGFTDPCIIAGPRGEKVDAKKHTEHLYSLRITPSGFMRIGELEKEVKKYQGFNRYITKIKDFSDKIMGMKWGIVLGITLFLIVCIFAFDIKVSQIIQKIPILSSIIDTGILEEFEAINEQDEFYRAMMGDSMASHPSEDTENASTAGSISKVTAKPIWKNIPVPKAIQNILPEKAKIADVTVRDISPAEKLFKITLDSGVVRYIQVKKESGKYEIVGR